MTVSIFIFLLTLLGALILCFAAADTGSILLLASVIVIPLVAAVINRFHKPKLEIMFDFPNQCEKKEEIGGAVKIRNSSFAGYRRLQANLHIRNRLTQENLDETVRTPLAAKEETRLDVSLKARYCGTLEISCDEIKLYDFFGLTFRKVKADNFCTVTVLPEVFPVSINFGAAFGAEDMESYATDCSGQDLSEVFDFVEYTPGDSLHQIQWKLSQKHNRLIVRRGSLPLEKSAVLIMTPSLSYPERLSAVAEATVSVAQSMCEAGIGYKMMIWENERFVGYEAENEEDLAALLPKLLSVSPHNNTVDSEEIYSGHKIIITDDIDKAVKYSENGAMVLLADGESAERITGFSSKNPSEDLFEFIL